MDFSFPFCFPDHCVLFNLDGEAELVSSTIIGTWYWASPKSLVSAHPPGTLCCQSERWSTLPFDWRQNFQLGDILDRVSDGFTVPGMSSLL